MAWYNPLDWGAAISRTGYTAVGHVASSMGATETGDYLKSIGTGYMSEKDVAPVAHHYQSQTPAQNIAAQYARAAESEASNLREKNVREVIHPATEAITTGIVQAPALVFTGPLGAAAVEQMTDSALEFQGEAPLYSPTKLINPITDKTRLGGLENIADFFVPSGNSYYQNGGVPLNYPGTTAGKILPTAPASQSPEPGYFDKFKSLASGLTFGMGSLLGLGVGGLVALFSPVAGAIVGTIGVVAGQSLLEQWNAPAQTQVAAAPPVTNHPRAQGADPSPAVSPSATVAAPQHKPVKGV